MNNTLYKIKIYITKMFVKCKERKCGRGSLKFILRGWGFLKLYFESLASLKSSHKHTRPAYHGFSKEKFDQQKKILSKNS